MNAKDRLAFPDPHIKGDGGMKLRDYFAIKIFVELLKNNDTDIDEDVEDAYRLADKLVKAGDA